MILRGVCLCAHATAAGHSGRFSVVKSAVHNKEKVSYAVKVVDNKSLSDDENLEALETEVRAPPPQRLSASPPPRSAPDRLNASTPQRLIA